MNWAPELTQENFLKMQHTVINHLIPALERLSDVTELGQITRHGVAVCCHVESLIALLERYRDGSVTLVYRPDWNVQP